MHGGAHGREFRHQIDRREEIHVRIVNGELDENRPSPMIDPGVAVQGVRDELSRLKRDSYPVGGRYSNSW